MSNISKVSDAVEVVHVPFHVCQCCLDLFLTETDLFSLPFERIDNSLDEMVVVPVDLLEDVPDFSVCPVCISEL